MAGDWLKFDKDTPEKPEVFEIASMLNIDPDSVVGKLMRVWSWFDSHTVDGNALRVTPALLDRCAGMVGFVTAMESVGWMVIENGGCRLPKFERHCGQTAKTRALGKNRTQKSRSSNAASVTDGVTGGVTETSLEKRREEKKEQKHPLPPGGGDSAGTEQPVQVANGKRLPIPYDDILAAFRHALPDLEQPQKVTNKRRREIGKAWDYLRPDHRTIGAFRAIFAECAEDPFYNGTGPYRDQNANWRPTFDFIIREDQFAKIYDRAMTRQQQRRAAGQAGQPVEAAA